MSAPKVVVGDPVLLAITQAAVVSTGASQGWLLAVEGGGLRVVAAAGGDDAGALLGATIPAEGGTAGFVAGTGQPLALAPRGDDARLSGGMVAVHGRRPATVLSVPCDTDDEVVGVLELVDKAGGASFTFDDVELATLLAGIAGVVLAHGSGSTTVPDPAELAGDLARLAVADPARYAAVAVAVAGLLDRG